jgi:hypothetical protein
MEKSVSEGIPMSRISRLERGRVTADWTALYVKLFAQRGNVPNIFRTMAHQPQNFSTRMAHFAAVLNTGKVPTRLKEVSFHRQHRAN